QPGEDSSLAATRRVLADAERIRQLCSESYASLYEHDDAVLSALGGVWRRVAELAEVEPRFQPYVDAREAIKAQLEDLALFLRSFAAGVDGSPGRLQDVEDRLALIERLKRRHGPTLEDLFARRASLRRELADLERGEETLEKYERAYRAARNQYLDAA